MRGSYDPGLSDLRGFVPVRDSALWNGACLDDYAVHLHVPAALGKFLLQDRRHAGFVLPLSAVSMLLPLLLPGSPLEPETASGPFRLHLLLAILAYSVMTMALIQGLLLMAVHKRVRSKDFISQDGAKHVNILDNMPSMMEMEKILFRLIWVGFIVLTAAILFGAVYSQELFGQAFRFDHKTVTTCLAWFIFGILLLGHHLRGWRGKFAALWTVIGFCVLMVSYIGVRFVMEVVPGA